MEKTLSLIIFLVTYILFIFLPNKRAWVAIVAAGLLLLTRTISLPEAFTAINWNVMGIFVGMLAVANIFMESKVPAYLAELIVEKARNTAWAILFICAMTASV